MGLFGNQAWDYLNTPDIECKGSDDDIVSWWVALASSLLCIVIAAVIGIYLHYKAINNQAYGEASLGKEHYQTFLRTNQLEYFFFRCWLVGVATTSRKQGAVILTMALIFVAWMFFTLFLLQKTPNGYSGLACISLGSFLFSILPYCFTTQRIPGVDDDSSSAAEQKYVPRNIYQDLSAPLVQVIFIFLLQVSLALMYILSVFDEQFPPCFNSSMAYFLYIAAAILKSFYHSFDYTAMVLANAWDDRKLWFETYSKLPAKGKEPTYEIVWATEPELTRKLTTFEWRIRHTFEIFVNYIVDIHVMFFMVIQAANGDFQDFVFNFIAAQFIMQVDDYATFNYETTFVVREVVVDDSDDDNISSTFQDDEKGD